MLNRGLHLTNWQRGGGPTSVYLWPFYSSEYTCGLRGLLWVDDIDSEVAIRETVRLYGEHFGVVISDDIAPYGFDHVQGLYTRDLGRGYFSLWFKHQRGDLSLFWRLYEQQCFELGKA